MKGLAQRTYDRFLGFAGVDGRMRREMNDVFRDAHRDARAAGLGAVLQLWFVATYDLARTARAQRHSAGRRRISAGQLLGSVVSDVRLGLRSIARNPGFSLVVVLTLALAIGVNSTIFSLTRLVLYPPMPISEPESLVFVRATNPELNRERAAVSLPDFDDFRRRSKTIAELAAYTSTSFTLTDVDEPVRLTGAYSTANLFAVFGSDPLMGRNFRPDDGEPGASEVVMLSHGAWERHFGVDPQILDRTITLDDTVYTIIGVLPSELEIGWFRSVDVWAPLAVEPARVARDQRNMSVVGRLHAGVSMEQAREELTAIAIALQQEFPRTNTGWETQILTFRQAVAGTNATVVSTLLGVSVLFVLIIACANVANLLLARAATRQKELAVRQALGARRSRLVRQLLTESAMLAVLGSVLGVFFATWTLRAFVALGRGTVTLFDEARIDGGVFLFALALGLSTPLLFGVVPALRSTRTNLATATNDASRGSSATFRHHRLAPSSPGTLAALQVALAVVLMVVSSLAVRTVTALVTMDLGFDATSVLTLRVELPRGAYAEGADKIMFFDRALTGIEATAGVERAAWVSHLPLLGGEPVQSVAIRGRGASSESDVPWLATVAVTPGFFETLRIPLLVGRPLSVDDNRDGVPVALVSEAAAQRYWAGASPVGDQIKLGGVDADSSWTEIVGVVADIRNPDADQPPEPHLYLPHAQSPASNMSLVARTGSDAAAATRGVRGAIWNVDNDQPIDDVRTMGQVLYEDFAGDISVAGLVATFGLVALSLATAGVYGMISYSVSRRDRELGIRMALGAGRSSVLTMVVRQGLAPVVFGLTLGLAAGFVVSRLMAGVLYGVGPNDPVTFLGIPALLATVGFLATLAPAIRATRIDPLEAIRAD